MNREDRRAAERDARREAVRAATKLAKDITEGTVSVGDLQATIDAKIAGQRRDVIGPGDPFWAEQTAIFRRVLEVGAPISADELSEWSAVYRSREENTKASWIETTLARLGDEDDDDQDAGQPE